MMVKVRFVKEHQALGLRTLSPTHINCPICKYLYHLDSEAKKTFTNQIHSVFSFLPVCFVLGLFSFPETRSNWMFSFSTSHGQPHQPSNTFKLESLSIMMEIKPNLPFLKMFKFPWKSPWPGFLLPLGHRILILTPYNSLQRTGRHQCQRAEDS